MVNTLFISRFGIWVKRPFQTVYKYNNDFL